MQRSSETDKPHRCCLKTDNGSWGWICNEKCPKRIGFGHCVKARAYWTFLMST
ncbi:hypothetical protein NEIMUCOT_04628 [Neisseria mucosa ATCC 25996]|uniref:Uncharacterized protein n=1 Tax=Neisseria mucosa (strain ATCC 25996 / DSM 4631 / NCTC 10774 / M26) TaxID=546266 RepID=D2ZVI5_NEIM2|nr:hypothetical protein NEIMUCOT_04628 [Neisseria mucosa ATCC 25996]